MTTTDTTRIWTMGDDEPADLPHTTDAYGDSWWCSKTERTSDKAHDGWRSNQMGYFDTAKSWWWLTMYRGPLREDA